MTPAEYNAHFTSVISYLPPVLKAQLQKRWNARTGSNADAVVAKAKAERSKAIERARANDMCSAEGCSFHGFPYCFRHES